MKPIRLIHIITILFAVGLVATACGKKDEGGDKKDDTAKKDTKKADTKKADTKKASVPPAEEAAKMFNTLCSACHGESGKGDGPGAQALDPKPRDYTDKEWQASVTDEDLKKVIVEGGPAVGKAATMAANPTLGKPEKKEVLDEIIKLIRAFGK
jgi:cytochrome c553